MPNFANLKPVSTSQPNFGSLTSTSTFTPTAPQSLPEQIWSGIAGGTGTVGNFLFGGASNLGTHIGEAAAIGTGKVATALTGNPSLEQHVTQKLAQPQNNIFGAPIKPIQGGVEGVKQLGGDALRTGAELTAFTAAPTKLLSAIGTGALIGGSEGAGNSLEKNATSADVLKQGGIGALIGGVAGGTTYGFGKLVGKIGDKIQTSIIKPTQADLADGFSIDTIKQYDLGGPLNTTLKKTQSKLNDLSTQLGEKLQGSNSAVNLNDVVQETIKELTDSSKLKGFGANAKIASTLEQLQNEANLVGNTLSVPDAQVVKQAAGQFGAWQYGKVDPESKASEIVYNTFYNKLKIAIEQNSPEGVQSINQELSKLIPIQNAILRRLPVAQRSGLISLNEMIGLVGSSLNPVALGPTLLALLSRSGIAANTLSKAGPAIAGASAPAALVSGQLQGLIGGTDQSGQSPQQPISSPETNTYSPEQQAAINSGIETALKIDPTGGIVGAEKGLAGAVLSRIHPEDVAVLTKFIDGVRLNKTLPLSVERGAQALAEHWGLDVQKSTSYLANEFERILNGTKKVKSTNMGQFTLQ